jgi:hypothetical protein
MKLLRKYKLTIGTPSYTKTDYEVVGGVKRKVNSRTEIPSNAVSIEDLEVSFNIEKSDNSSKNLNSAEITIKNLSESTKALIEKEDSVVILEAGWEDDTFGLIFQGDITSYKHNKRGTNYDTIIECADGYVGIRESITHKTYPEGTSVQAVLLDLIKGEGGETVYYTAKGETQGTRPPIGLGFDIGEMSGLGLFEVFENGYTVSKPTKQAIDDICYAYRLKWSIQDGKVYVTDLNGDTSYKYTVPLISEETGLIGSPEEINEGKAKRKGDKTPSKGYRFVCTLNHEIIPELFIKLSAEQINAVAKVKKVTHRGSYEGDSWETEVECIIQDIE